MTHYLESMGLKPVHFPHESQEGPWGVNSVGGMWYVIHKETLRRKVIGRVIGFAAVSSRNPDYFGRALDEAHRRNLKERSK